MPLPAELQSVSSAKPQLEPAITQVFTSLRRNHGLLCELTARLEQLRNRVCPSAVPDAAVGDNKLSQSPARSGLVGELLDLADETNLTIRSAHELLDQITSQI